MWQQWPQQWVQSSIVVEQNNEFSRARCPLWRTSTHSCNICQFSGEAARILEEEKDLLFTPSPLPSMEELDRRRSQKEAWSLSGPPHNFQRHLTCYTEPFWLYRSPISWIIGTVENCVRIYHKIMYEDDSAIMSASERHKNYDLASVKCDVLKSRIQLFCILYF